MIVIKDILFLLLTVFIFQSQAQAQESDIFKDWKILEGVEKKVKDFRFKTYKKRPKNKDDKLYQAYDKNDIFKTYLIEVISKEKFVLYPVIWRNQGIIE